MGEGADGESEPDGSAATIQQGEGGDEGDHEEGVAAVAGGAGDGRGEAENIGDVTEIEDDATEEDRPEINRWATTSEPDRDEEGGQEVADLVEGAVEHELRLIAGQDPERDEAEPNWRDGTEIPEKSWVSHHSNASISKEPSLKSALD